MRDFEGNLENKKKNTETQRKQMHGEGGVYRKKIRKNIVVL